MFADLGMAPLSNAFLTAAQLDRMEPFFPLRALVCSRCFLVQLGEYEAPSSIFSDYVYFSSWSTTWVAHAAAFAKRAATELGLDGASRVVEVASNDGYLLAHFVDMGIPVLGIEPAANVAEAAVARGVPTVTEFFGAELARRLAGEHRADLLVGNNVLAHVPDLHDFVAGLRILLAPDGLVSLEFPHLLRLMADLQFDTIYHEHFSYFSFQTVRRVFAAHGLRLFDVEELTTHGGSLRIFGCHEDDDAKPDGERATALLRRELDAGFDQLAVYEDYARHVQEFKRDILEFFIECKRAGRTIVGYGAPAKGNTLLNYCGIGRDFIDYTVDLNPGKQGHYLPGTHIPIRSPEMLRETRPDIVFILPWNLKVEIVEQLSFVADWGGQFAARNDLTLQA